MPLAALPGGTVNVLPKRLSGAMTLEETIAALGQGDFDVTKLDCGFADNHPFFVGAAFGMVPELAKLREDFRVTRGVRDAVKLSGRVFRTAPRLMRPVVVLESGRRQTRIPALVASVERIEDWGSTTEGPSFHGFDCVALCAERWSQVAGILARAMWRGNWREHSCIETFRLSQLVVSAGRHTWLTLDGEPMRLPSPVRLKYARQKIPVISFPKALREAKDNDASDRSSLRPARTA
jgi:diacylglycerol kinase family enzyme